MKRQISATSSSSQQQPAESVTIDKPLVDRNFREKFIESQNRIKKTGSVVRFADEVDLPEELKRGGKDREPVSPLVEDDVNPVGILKGGALSSSSTARGHRGSVGSINSVAAVSDDEDDDEDDEGEGGGMMMLPRTKSQLSLLVDDMKRRQSSSAGADQDEEEGAVASPESVRSSSSASKQEKLNRERLKKKREEEDKLLAMGRKGGVTKAGGVQFPESMKLKRDEKGSILGEGIESPEQPLY